MDHIKSIRQIAVAIAFSLVLFCSGLFVMDVHADETPSNDPSFMEINNHEMPGKESWSVTAESELGQKVGLGKGTISFDVETLTLTLDNVTLYQNPTGENAIYYCGDATVLTKEKRFTIRLIGDNSIQVPTGQYEGYCGIHLYSARDVYIDGPGTLTIISENEKSNVSGIWTQRVDRLTIGNNATININMNSKNQYGIYCVNKLAVTGNATVNVSGNPEKGIYFEKRFSIDQARVTATGTKAAVWNDNGVLYDADGITVNNGTLVAKAEEWPGIAIYSDYESHGHKGPFLQVTGNSEVDASGAYKALSTEYPKASYLELDPNGYTMRLEMTQDRSDTRYYHSRHDYLTNHQIYLSDFLDTDSAYNVGEYTKIHIYTVGATDTGAAQPDTNECSHDYGWITAQQATATSDGEMRYVCADCGDVEYSVPVTAYYTFNKETQEKVLKAAQGATVKVQTPWFISFHEMVYKALQERPDVTLVVDYKNGDGLYEMTIPAGSGDQLQSLFGESRFAGFLYLGGTYATNELPRDTVFDGMSATEMWFGTTNAH